MASSDELAAFIASSFRSVWALELFLYLKRESRPCSHDELVTSLRASPAVVDKALEALVAAGLVGQHGDAFAYMPVSPDVATLVEETEQLYRSRPDRVRRLIVASANKGLAAFSEAFRLKD
jgi:predicted transcriptional regulator